MATTRLYLRDPFLLEFASRVAHVGVWSGAPALVLEASAFYPEGGGQLADQGALDVEGLRLEVADVQVDDAGVVHHVLGGPAPSGLEGRACSGRVDGARRRDHMSQHTGQHLLSAALLDLVGAETVSSRLGAETSTIDVSIAGLPEARVAIAEDAVNDVILADREVRVLFPTPDELAALPLRRGPKVDADVRVVAIDGFDVSPCGGTHCTRTGQVGPVRVVGMERHKGGTRVTFLAGKRALADYREKDRVLGELARGFTCGPLDVPAAIGRLRSDLKDRMDQLGRARGELVALHAARIHDAHPVDASGTTRVLVVREDDELPALRALASSLTRRSDVVALVASRDPAGGDWLLVVERGTEARFDAGAWLKEASRSVGGRGGGRPERAEGRLPASADLAALFGA